MRKLVHRTIDFLKKQFSEENKELPYYLLIVLSFLFFVLATNLFIELTEELPGAPLEAYDQRITDYISSFRTPALTDFFIVITDIGDIYGYLLLTAIAIGVFLFKFKSWEFVLQLIGVLIIAALSNMALKRAIDRARPTAEHLVVVETLSYPSGHAMSAMAFYGFLTYLLFRMKMASWLRILLAVLFIFMILAIGISRIYLGVHYPSDVAGGYIAGLIWVAFCISLFNIIDLLRRRNKRKGEV